MAKAFHNQPSIDRAEHDETYGVKKVAIFGYDPSGPSMVQLAVDSDGKLKVVGDISIGGTTSTIYHGRQMVSTAGTAVQLASSQSIKWVIIKALSTNDSVIFVGGSDVSAENGYILSPGEAIGLDIDNLSKVYIDSSTDGDGVSYIACN